MSALGAAGVSVDDIGHVIFSHAHPDHLWGALDGLDEPLFANASHHIGRIERDYWIKPETLQCLTDDRKSFANGASRRIRALADRLEAFDDAIEIFPGIISRLTPGHTPGHMSSK